jgi:C-22 sterol desaturase
MTMQKSLIYSTAVVREALRYRPPIPIITHEITTPLPPAHSYTIPKGAIVIPSYYTALHDPYAYTDAYPEPGFIQS